MKRKRNRWDRGKREVWARDRGREQRTWREKRCKDRWIEQRFHLSGFFVCNFSSLSSRSCHRLVISQHKIPRISSGHGGCSRTLLNHRQSRQSLNKCLIKLLQCYMWTWKPLVALVENGNAFKQSTQEMRVKLCARFVVIIGHTVWHAVIILLSQLDTLPWSGDL